MTIIATLLFTLSTTSISHLYLSHRRSNSQVASNQAQSILAKALASIIDDQAFGVSGESLELDSLPQTYLSFSAESARPHSVNNIEGEGTVLGWNDRLVPPQSIHLVAESQVGTSTRIAEALYTIPVFPYAVASSQAIVSEGTLVVGRVESVGAAKRSLAKNDLLPADISSNADQSSAVNLGPGAYVAGDVTAVGQVALGDGVNILGQVRNGAGRISLPRMDLSRYDPGGQSSTLNVGNAPGAATGFPRSVEGLVRYSGNLNVSGPLELDNGILFVDGNLTLRPDHTLRGGLHGYGAVIVTGSTYIKGASELNHVNGVALLSKDDITIEGTGSETSFFQGLVYSEGSVEVEEITVLGALISNSDSGSDRVLLKNARAIHLNDSLQIDVGSPPSWTMEVFKAPPEPPASNDANIPLRDQAGLESLYADYNVYYDTDTESVVVVATGKATINIKSVVSIVEQGGVSGSSEGGASQVEALVGARARAGGSSVNQFERDGPAAGEDTTNGILSGPGADLTGVGQLDALRGNQFEFSVPLDVLRNNENALVGMSLTVPSLNQQLHSDEFSYSTTTSYELGRAGINLDVQNARALRDQILRNITPGGPTTRYNFDPNEFLTLADKIRLKYLRVR